MESITINFVIEDFSIKGLSTKMPMIVRKEAIRPSSDRNS